MKKIIITLLLAALPFAAGAQTAFDKFQEMEGVDYVAVNKEMFDMLSKMDASIEGEKTEKYMELIDQIDNLRVFTTSERKPRKELTEAVQDYLKLNTLEELMSVKDEGSTVKIYVNQGGEASIIKEGLIFIEDKDDKGVVVVSFTGNLNLEDLKGLKGLK